MNPIARISIWPCAGLLLFLPLQISVGGSYRTDVSLQTNTCSNVTVEPRPTTVGHQPGDSVLTVTHAGVTYSGTVTRKGAFSTDSRVLEGGGTTYTIDLKGQFSRTGFEAAVTVRERQGSAGSDCQYVVRWLGTKEGPPNKLE